jgi:hypothetical protein
VVATHYAKVGPLVTIGVASGCPPFIRSERLTMKLEVKQIMVGDIDDKSVVTSQWSAAVFDGKKKVFQSIGYHYATEARLAGIAWIDRHTVTNAAK